MKRFAVRLKSLYDAKGLSPYHVWKQTGVAQNTVKRYAQSDVVIVGTLEPAVIALAQFYGVDWKTVVDIVEDEVPPEIQNPLIA